MKRPADGSRPASAAAWSCVPASRSSASSSATAPAASRGAWAAARLASAATCSRGARAPQHTAADIHARLLAAEPHATAGRKRQLRVEAAKQARLSPLSIDRPVSLSNPHRFAERCARCPPAVPGLSAGLGAVEPVGGDVVGEVAGWALSAMLRTVAG